MDKDQVDCARRNASAELGEEGLKTIDELTARSVTGVRVHTYVCMYVCIYVCMC